MQNLGQRIHRASRNLNHESCILYHETMRTTFEFIKIHNPSIRIIFSVSIISVVSLICYGNSLDNNFVFDDKAVIVKNELVKDIHNIPLIFTTSYWEGYRWEGIEKNEQSLYRPLVIFSYNLNHFISGTNPFSYHLINLILLCLIAFWYFYSVFTSLNPGDGFHL